MPTFHPALSLLRFGRGVPGGREPGPSRSPVSARLVLFFMMGAGVPACGPSERQTETAEADGARPPFYTTLSRLPVDFATAGTVAGSGWAGAWMEGGTLTIEGRFEGLISRVTEAHVHRARPGLRGPSIAPLEVAPDSGGTSGTFRGTLGLDPELEAALGAGELYVQIHSSTNPDGAVRGWLFPGQ